MPWRVTGVCKMNVSIDVIFMEQMQGAWHSVVRHRQKKGIQTRFLRWAEFIAIRIVAEWGIVKGAEVIRDCRLRTPLNEQNRTRAFKGLTSAFKHLQLHAFNI